ncbi:MAG: hydroxyacid dehydrogenase [Candidatus Falkowbacteria bacterium]|nr:MAG: hydroxyacid dehydrogenase [Candidatus Falkowbacteria bacterium]
MANKTKVAFFELEKWEEKYISARLAKEKALTLEFHNTQVKQKDIKSLREIDILAAFIYSSLDKATLEKLSKLKMIATMSTGYDHIDLDVCAKRKIKVSNVPFYGENTVAEHTLALLLALSRKLVPSVERARTGNFSLDGLRGFDLKGKTIGLVGLGHIGSKFAEMVSSLGMNILVYDLKPNKELAKKLKLKYVSLEYLLANSDIISLHVPYNKFTHHLINSKNIKLIKRGAYLLNTSRGGLVSSSALLKALDSGILAGAGLDVLEEEGFIKEEKELLSKEFNKKFDLKTVLRNHLLLQHPKVIITPHNAFNSEEALLRILDMTIENILAYQKKKPINLVSA